MPRLSVRMLGPMQVAVDGEPVTDFVTDKARALLAYLAVETSRPHRRESLAALLWPERSESAARASLRRALADLRRALGDRSTDPPLILATRQSIQLSPDADVWVDVTEFLAAQGDTSPIPQVEEGVNLYHGDFLEGLSTEDAAAFEEWSLLQREQLRRHLLADLRRLASHFGKKGDLKKALDCAWRRVEADAWNEEANRQLMRLLVMSGDRSAAISQYESMRRTLQRELGVEPEEASTALVHRIRAGDLRPPDESEEGAQAPEEPSRAVGSCPYRGLAAFREEDAPFFHGRERFVADLVDTIQRRSVVAVIVGSSGSGKSSTVFAGLLPRLRSEPGWAIIQLRPGGEPFHALAAALLPGLEPSMSETDRLVESRKLGGALSTGEVRLRDVVERVLSEEAPPSRLLLLVDQFEELYTLSPNTETVRRFIDELLTAAAGPSNAPLALLITLRADFMGQALNHRPLADALQDSSVMLGPMTRDELRQAIERPAATQGAEFEPGLVERLLDDVGHEPGNLPLLEFALTLLWDRHSDGLLTHSAYEAIGCVQGAIAGYADEVFEALDDTDRQQARFIFGQLVQPGQGTEDTRRVATRSELGDEVWGLAGRLADRRLVVTGQDAAGRDVVEVVHEALIQRWDRLRGWIDADRAFRVWQEGLRVGLRAWKGAAHDEGALLRGAPLAEAERWHAEHADRLSDEETEYISACIAMRERTRAETERRRRRTILALGSLLVVAVAFAVYAIVARSDAQREAEANRSLVLTAAAEEAAARGDGNLALALALEAVAIDNPPREAHATLAAIAYGPGTRAVLVGHSDQVRAVALDPGGRRALSGSCAEKGPAGNCARGELIVWDLQSATEATRFAGHTDWVTGVAYGPDDARAVSASADGSLIVWDMTSLEPIHDMADGTAAVASLALDPDGRIAAAGSDDGTIVLWDVATAQIIDRLQGHSDAVTSVTFDTTGERLLSASEDAVAILWQVSTGTALRQFEGHVGPVTAARFHPDGTRIFTLGRDLTLRAWDQDTGAEEMSTTLSAEPARLAITPDGGTVIASVKTDLGRWDATSLQSEGFLVGHQISETAEGDVTSLAISNDGRLGVSAGTDGTLRVWNLGVQGVRPFPTDGTGVNAVAVNDDGELLLTADFAGAVTLWDTADARVIRRFGPIESPAAPNCLGFGPESEVALACAANPGASPEESAFVLWDLDTGEEIRRFNDHVASARALAFSPDGRSILTGSQDFPDYTIGDMVLWDRATGDTIRRFDLEHDVTDIEISADGNRALTSSGTNSVAILWDMDTGEQTRRFEEHPAPLLNVAFGPGEETVLAASWDGSIYVSDIATGARLRTFKGHEATAWALDVSPDGRFVVSGSEDGVVILWDFATGQELRRLQAHSAAAIDVAFHPDGLSVFTVGWDGAVLEWEDLDTSPDELVEWIAQNRYVRELTCDEAAAYGVGIAGCG